MLLTISNPNGAIGSLPSLPNAAKLPYGDTYEVFTNDSEGLKLVGMGHIIFNINDFIILDSKP